MTSHFFLVFLWHKYILSKEHLHLIQDIYFMQNLSPSLVIPATTLFVYGSDQTLASTFEHTQTPTGQ